MQHKQCTYISKYQRIGMCYTCLNELQNVWRPDLCQMQWLLFGLLWSIQILPIIYLKIFVPDKIDKYNNITYIHQAVQFSKISLSIFQYFVAYLTDIILFKKYWMMSTLKVNADMVHVDENCISTQNLLSSQGDKVVINLMCIRFVKQGNNFHRKKELHVEKNHITSLHTGALTPNVK